MGEKDEICSGKQENDVENMSNSSLKLTSAENTNSKSEIFTNSSPLLPDADKIDEQQNFSNNILIQTKESLAVEGCTRMEPEKGRASLIRLQAISNRNGEASESDNVNSELIPDDPINRSSSRFHITTIDSSWTAASVSDRSDIDKDFVSVAHFSSTSRDIMESSNFMSSSNSDEISSSLAMQRFLTSDGQYVYGYKDINGEFHFFYPTLSERESHNEKERIRRSRVSDACSSLRKLIPGLSEKTDKASVFEQAARYLRFLRDKYGTQFDQL